MPNSGIDEFRVSMLQRLADVTQRLSVTSRMDNIFLEDIRRACKNSIARPAAGSEVTEVKGEEDGATFPGLTLMDRRSPSIRPFFRRESPARCLFFVFPRIKRHVRQVILSRWMTSRMHAIRSDAKLPRDRAAGMQLQSPRNRVPLLTPFAVKITAMIEYRILRRA